MHVHGVGTIQGWGLFRSAIAMCGNNSREYGKYDQNAVQLILTGLELMAPCRQ